MKVKSDKIRGIKFFLGERERVGNLSPDQLSRALSVHAETLFNEDVLSTPQDDQQRVLAGIIIELIAHGNLQRASMMYEHALNRLGVIDVKAVMDTLPNMQALVDLVVHTSPFLLPSKPQDFLKHASTRNFEFS